MLKEIALFFTFVFISAASFAHHSPASYDTENKVTLRGVLKSISIRNPHSEFILSVPNGKGALEEWQIEGSAGVLLRRRGWDFTRIKVGEEVTITGFPNKSGTKNMYILEIKIKDGTVYGRPDETKVLD